MTTIYGIPNCDTMKKARKWLADNNIEADFHDYKKAGITEEKINQWLTQVSWEVLLNKRGMMWRKLDDETKNSMDEAMAIKTMIDIPSIIKRPVLEHQGKLSVGFKADDYESLFHS